LSGKSVIRPRSGPLTKRERITRRHHHRRVAVALMAAFAIVEAAMDPQPADSVTVESQLDTLEEAA